MAKQIADLEIWQQYKNEKNETEKMALRNHLIEKYFPYVKKIAKTLSEKIGRKLTEEELASFGVDGLFVAIKKFDIDRGIKFESYASSRIKGSMLDEMRKLDKIPRSVRMNNHGFELAKGQIESEKGHRVSDIEVAESMGVNNFFSNIKSYKPTTYSSLDGLSSNEDADDFKQDCNVNLTDGKAVVPDSSVIRKEFFNKLVGKNFSDIERKIVYMYYYEGLTMDIIAKKVHLSESRVSQLHTNMMPRLKDKVLRNPNYFSNIISFLSNLNNSNLLNS